MIKRDCRMWDNKNKECKGLKELVCLLGKCSFYCTAEEYLKKQHEALRIQEEHGCYVAK